MTTKRTYLKNVETDFLKCRAVTRHQWCEVGLFKGSSGHYTHIVSDCAQCGGSKVQTIITGTGERYGSTAYFHPEGYLAHTGGDRVTLADGRREYVRRSTLRSHDEFITAVTDRRTR